MSNTIEASFFIDQETKWDSNEFMGLMCEKTKSIHFPQVGDIWFSHSGLPKNSNSSVLLFLVSSVKYSGDNTGIVEVVLNDWSGNPQKDIQKGFLSFNKEGITRSRDFFTSMVGHEGLSVSRNTSYRLLPPERRDSSLRTVFKAQEATLKQKA